MNDPRRVSLGAVLAGLALGALTLLAAFGVWQAFKIGGVRDITVHGWIALSLAVVLTGALAGGLVWLAFYSSRHGYDDGPSKD
jgi:hypothetical protein